MDYSCTTIARYVLNSIETQLKPLLLSNSASNVLPNGGFFERSDEQEGAIVGCVWKTSLEHGEPYVQQAGTFRIEPDGKITRFPGVPKSIKDKAEQEAATKYRQVFGKAAYSSVLSRRRKRKNKQKI